MSVFTETAAKAVADYRGLLRRYLDQQERQQKIEQLSLCDPKLFNNEVALFHTAQAIVKDIENNIQVPNQGYYAYNGIHEFCGYLKEFLKHYEIKNNNVLHKAQRASRAFIYAIQVLALPQERLDDNHTEQLLQYNDTIAHYGTPEQHELYLDNLKEHSEQYQGFYLPIQQDFEQRLAETP